MRPAVCGAHLNFRTHRGTARREEEAEDRDKRRRKEICGDAMQSSAIGVLTVLLSALIWPGNAQGNPSSVMRMERGAAGSTVPYDPAYDGE